MSRWKGVKVLKRLVGLTGAALGGTRNEGGNVGRGVVCRFKHGDGAWRKEVFVGLFFVNLGNRGRLIGRTERVVGRGT